jgi:hypothetical protein
MKYLILIASILSLASFTSCSSDPNVRQGQIGGAAIGGVATGLLTNSWGGAAVGAAVGGLVGGELQK